MYIYKDPQATADPVTGITVGQADPQVKLNPPSDIRMTPALMKSIDAAVDQWRYTQEQRASYSDRNEQIEAALEGAELKIGPWNTGISWDNKHSLAAAIAVGDQIGDAYRGIKQLFVQNNLIDDEDYIAQQDANEEIMRQLYDYDVYKSATYPGAVVGAVAEPLGLLLPMGKSASVAKAFTKGAILTGLYGASLYVDGNESRLRNAALGALIGGPANALINKYIQHTIGSEVHKRIEAAKKFDLDVEKAVYANWSKNAAVRAAAGNVNRNARNTGKNLPRTDKFKNEIIDDWFDQQVKEAKLGGLDETGTPKDWFADQVADLQKPQVLDNPAKKRAAKARRKALQKRMKERYTPRSEEEVTQADTVASIEAKAAIEGKRHGLFHRHWGMVDRILRPVADAIGSYSPRVAAKLRNADATQHLMQHGWGTRAKPFYEWLHSLSKENAFQMKRLLANGGLNKATMNLIKQLGGDEQVANAKAVKSVLDQILKDYKKVGYKIGTIPDYFPLAVKDLKGLTKKEQGAIDRLLESARKKKGKALSQNEKNQLAENYFTFDVRYSRTSGSQKQRLKQKITDDELQFYHDPGTTLQYYIHTAAEDLAKRRFFQGFGYKPGKNGLDATGADIDKSIDTLIDTIKADVPDAEGQAQIVRMLRSRFSSDVMSTHKFVQDLKNASYSITLGNWWSAMTQIGDLVFAFHKYGAKNAVKAILGPKVVDKAELGVEKALAELVSDQRRFMARVADWAFKWSGFDAVDRFGKNVNINAALRKNIDLAKKDPGKFRAKWANNFGDETEALLNELEHLKLAKDQPLSDNAMLMLWNELADIQPIGLSEMPEMYLRMPNGRIFYAYKTFAIKQLNYMRNQLNTDKNAFRKGYNLMMFAAAFVVANGTIDGFKEWMAGEPIHLEDRFYDNMLGLVGTSKYATEKSQGLGGVLAHMLQPVPVMQHLGALDKVSSGDFGAGDIADQTPLFGKLNREWDIIR